MEIERRKEGGERMGGRETERHTHTEPFTPGLGFKPRTLNKSSPLNKSATHQHSTLTAGGSLRATTTSSNPPLPAATSGSRSAF